MSKYLKPAIEMEVFEVEDVITASGEGSLDIGTGGPGSGGMGMDMNSSAPIMVDFN